jgi:hypothetical protein
MKPSSESFIAEASPMPDPAPVIHATLFTMVISFNLKFSSITEISLTLTKKLK